jgi:hypothetical protein
MGNPQVALAHYVRLRLGNRSWWKTARNVEVLLERISRKATASGRYVEEGSVFGINLEWSHSIPSSALMPQIGAGTSRILHLGHVVRPADRPKLAVVSHVIP